jgi:hypothetical protein
MEREKDMRATVSSGRGTAVAGRTLYPLVTPRLVSTPAASRQDASWVDANPEEWEALISVWWDNPPGGDPR